MNGFNTNYPVIEQVLGAVFDVDYGFSERVAAGLYLRAVVNRADTEGTKRELRSAFADPTFSWKNMLANDEREVCDIDSEEEAREYALKMLWTPLVQAGLV